MSVMKVRNVWWPKNAMVLKDFAHVLGGATMSMMQVRKVW